MIRESWPWKQELKRHKRALAKLSAVPLPEDTPDFKIEKPLHYSAMIMRRLIECGKATDKMRAIRYEIGAYPTLAGRHDVMARLTMQGDIDEEFDLQAPTIAHLDCWNICNELLHSGFINWEIDQDGRFVAIYVASIRNHVTRLIRIPLSTYLELIEAVLNDHVQGGIWKIEGGKLHTERF